jgi:hypothetical protein
MLLFLQSNHKKEPTRHQAPGTNATNTSALASANVSLLCSITCLLCLKMPSIKEAKNYENLSIKNERCSTRDGTAD